jgi:flagellar hook-associated protein 1 FlgK
MDLGTSLSIGLTGLQVNQDAISVVGHNIANVNTPGYSQQSAVISTNPSQPYGTMNFGTGASVTAVQALRDQFLNLQVTQSIASQSGAQTRYQGVEAVSSAVTDDGTTGLSTQIQSFFASLQTLASNPESAAQRQAVLGQAQTMINEFQSSYQTISSQISNANQEVGSVVQQVNTLTSQIAQLNGQIASQVDPTGDNDAIDQRQQLTDQLANLVGIQVSTDSKDQYQISLDTGAAILVAGANAYQMTTSPDASNSNNLSVQVQSGNMAVDVTDQVNGGTLGGYMDLRDNILPGYEDQLNRIAGSLASQVNAQNEAGYVLPNTDATSASTGPALFTGGFTASGAPDYTNFVNTLQVNPAVLANTNLIATAGSAGSGSGDNANALLLANLQNTGTVDVNGDGSVQSGPYTTVVTNLTNTVATDAQRYNTIYTNQQNLNSALQSQKTSLSGVDLDQQAAQLIAYQQGYEAAAHFISTISQLTTQLMNTVTSATS